MPGELIPIVLFIAVVVVIKILSDNRIKRMAIEKGLVNEDLKYLYQNSFESKLPTSLKWGLVFVAIGLAFLIGRLMPGFKEDFTVALMFILGGLALVSFYFIAPRLEKKS